MKLQVVDAAAAELPTVADRLDTTMATAAVADLADPRRTTAAAAAAHLVLSFQLPTSMFYQTFFSANPT